MKQPDNHIELGAIIKDNIDDAGNTNYFVLIEKLDQYYADFYKNKIPERIKISTYPHTSTSANMAKKQGFNKAINQLTAQFNSKEGNVMGDTTKVNRLEVIDETGRGYVKGLIYGTPVEVELDLQDDGRTLKVFVKPVKEKIMPSNTSDQDNRISRPLNLKSSQKLELDQPTDKQVDEYLMSEEHLGALPPQTNNVYEQREQILEIAIRWREAVEKLEKLDGKMPSEWIGDEIQSLLTQAEARGRVDENKEWIKVVKDGNPELVELFKDRLASLTNTEVEDE